MTVAVVMRVQRGQGSNRIPPVASSAVREVRAFLTDNKLTLLSGLETVDSLIAWGSIQDIQSAFRVHLYTWRQQATDRVFFANDGPISIPSQLSTSVIGVLGLDDYPVALPADGTSRPSLLSARNGYRLSPQQMQRAYGLSSLLASSSCNRSACDGTGQGVAIYAQGGFYRNNINDFSTQWGLKPPNLVVRSWIPNQSGLPNFTPPSLDAASDHALPSHDNSEAEAELDIEAVHSLAPGATIHVYEFPVYKPPPPSVSSVTDAGAAYYYTSLELTYAAFFSAVLNSVDRDPDNVLSISFGDCESEFSPSERYSLDQELHDVALDGRTVLVATGDDGRYCGSSTGNTLIGPNFPASDPYVTGVGGTSLTVDRDGSYQNEAAWDTGRWVDSLGASGGSFKSSFPRPDWQGNIGQRGENRLVPDVAAVADPNADSLEIFAWCLTRTVGPINVDVNCRKPGEGTSLAAPLWAGFVAVYNEYAQSHGKGALGFANPVLYYLASHPKQLTPGALTDITANPPSTNEVAGPAGPGWDAATGVGSFNAAAFVHDRLDQHLSLLPSAGPNGTEVLARATGFPPGEAIGFSVGGGISSCTATTDSSGTASCSLNVRWNTALGPQVRIDASDDLALLSAAATFQASSTIPSTSPVLAVGTITTVAGNGEQACSGFGGSAISAQLIYPQYVAVDAAGDLYIAACNRILKVEPGGTITSVAGNGTFGDSGDGGPATSAQVSPFGVAVDDAGNLYFSHAGETVGNVIRKVDTSGTISRVAGNGTAGYSGDGGPATAAQLGNPGAVAADRIGNLYIADISNNRVRKVDASGIITTVAGNGNAGHSGDGGPAKAAELDSPSAVAVDSAGDLYIVDHNRIRKVDASGIITTVAGNGTAGYSGDGGPATAAQFSFVTGVAVDSTGNLYVGDCNNNRIRKVNTAGIITTVVGNGTAGYSGDGGPATSAQLKCSYTSTGLGGQTQSQGSLGVAVDSAGDLYIADRDNGRVRKVTWR